MKRFISFVLFTLVLLLMVYPSGNTQAASASQSIAPASMTTFTGATAGGVANLAVQNQAGTADNPANYVTFTTPGTVLYNGYRQFALPASITTSTITAMNVKVNYKGLTKASQRWLWFLYDWTAAQWVYIGDNTAATLNTWTAITFPTTSPQRFVSPSRAIRLLLQSNNATGIAKLDFESVNVTYTTPEISSPIYSDALLNGWGDWSWNLTQNLANTAPVHGGTKSVAVTYTEGWDGLQFGRNTALNISAYNTLRFWVHGGASGGQVVQVQVKDENGIVQLTKNITPQANTWAQVNVPLVGLSQVTLLAWFNNTSGAQSTFYIDDVAFIGPGGPTPTPSRTPTPAGGPALNVNVASGRHAISPHIYGMNFAEEALAADLNLPVRRWGGNSTTRYNWQINVNNTASDWYFENIPLDNASSADSFVAQNNRTGTETLMTIPMIGWTPKAGALTHPYDCGFKVSKYGAQKSTDSDWDPNCGNGIKTDDSNVTDNDPADTSFAITPAFVTNWINHLKATYGDAASGGVEFYNLDNEPMLWNSTHRDVHPTPVTYNEMKTRTEAYAAAIKAADPTAKTLGPAEWGWCGYFYSAADGCSPGGSDRAAHSGADFIPWYLQQMKAYQTAHGVRILDYLDLHVYPQGAGVYSDNLGDANVQALRLRSTRQLWDPTYVDESWIGQPVQLLPRMRAWVTNNYPGTKLAISEYSWGAMGHLNGALAQADILGIFGRQNLDMATLWGPPTATQPGAYAFRMYRNYDGGHHGFGDTGVYAASVDQARLAVYAAQRSSDSALTLIVINKTGGALTSTLSLAGFTPAGAAQVYRYSAANLNAIQHLANQAVLASGFAASYPANSITLLVIPGTAP